MRISIVLVFSFLLIFLSGCTSNAYASADSKLNIIDPASPFYFLKSVEEMWQLKFTKSSQEKGLKYLEFASSRIIEVKSLVSNNRGDLVPPALEKYWSSLSKILGLVNINNEVLGPQIVEKVENHILILSSLQNQTTNPKAQIAIRSTIYRISNWNKDFFGKLNTEQKNKLLAKITSNQDTICKFLSKEASSSALNQTEKMTISKRAQECITNSKLFSL